MKLAIENFARIQAENKVLVLGAMAELGNESLEEHRAIIDLIKQNKWKEVVLVGGDFLKIHSLSLLLIMLQKPKTGGSSNILKIPTC